MFFLGFLFLLGNSGASNTKLNIVNSALEYYKSRSVVLILDEKVMSSDVAFINLQKQLSSSFYFSSLTRSKVMRKSLQSSRQGVRETVVVLDPNKTFLRLLEKVFNEIDITPFKWLLTTPALTAQNMTNLTVPLHSEFIIARGDSPSGYSLTEIYDIRPKEKSAKILAHSIAGEPFQIEPDLFKRRKNLGGALIKVVSPKPDSCEGMSFSKGIATIVCCIHQNLWKVMAEMINATTVVKVIPNLTAEVLPNTDAELTYRSAPLNVVDLNTRSYVWPIFRVKVEITTSYLRPKVEWGTYISPFSLQMWMLIIAWVVLGDLVLASAQFISTRKGDGNSFLRWCNECSFSAAYSFCSQGVSEPSTSSSTRIIFLMLFLVPGVLFPGYSAVLTSYLTVQVYKKPFRTLQELSRMKDYKLGWHSTFAVEHMFNLKDKSSLNQALLQNNVLPQDKLPATDYEGIERMCTQKFSFVTIKETLLALKPKCKYYELPQHFKVVSTSIELKKGSWYKYLLDRCARTMEFSGVQYREKVQVVMKYVKYHQTFKIENSDVPPIKIENILLPFAVLLLGIIASFIFLIFEVFCFRMKSTGKHNLPTRKKIIKKPRYLQWDT